MNNCMCGVCDYCCDDDCERDGDWEECPENKKLLQEYEPWIKECSGPDLKPEAAAKRPGLP